MLLALLWVYFILSGENNLSLSVVDPHQSPLVRIIIIKVSYTLVENDVMVWLI